MKKHNSRKAARPEPVAVNKDTNRLTRTSTCTDQSPTSSGDARLTVSELTRIGRQVLAGAIHEAGHVIAARHLGLAVNSVIYLPGADGAAYGCVEALPCGVFDAYVLAAGHVAHLRAAGRKFSLPIRLAAFPDRERIRESLGQGLTKDQFYTYLFKIEDDVAGFLYQAQVWEIVTKVGEALATSGFLEGIDCMALTEDVPTVALAEIQRIMVDPAFHNHMGRRFSRAERAEMDKLLTEAVRLIRPAFEKAPDLVGLAASLQDEGYSSREAENMLRPHQEFWRIQQPGHR